MAGTVDEMYFGNTNRVEVIDIGNCEKRKDLSLGLKDIILKNKLLSVRGWAVYISQEVKLVK